MLKKKYRLFDPIDNDFLTSYDTKLWPFYAYEIIAPQIENQDIFAKFFLSVMRVENKRFSVDEFTYDSTSINRTKRMIKQQLPTLFSDELLDKIVTNIKDLNVVKSNKISIERFHELFTNAVNLSNNLKKVILLQDAVSGQVVPHIDFIADFDSISKSNLWFDIRHAKHKKPSLLQIQKAYNYAQVIEEKHHDNSEEDDYEDVWFDDEEDLDEQFLSKLMQDELVTSEILSSGDIDKSSHILFLSDQPELVYFEFLPYSSAITNEISFLSPFFDSSNSWFNELVHKSRNISHQVDQLFHEIEVVSEEKHNKYHAEIESKKKTEISESTRNQFQSDELYKMLEELQQPSLLFTYNEIQKLQHINARTVNTEYVIFLEDLFNLISKPYDSEFVEIKQFISNGRNKFRDTLQFLANMRQLELPYVYYDKKRYEQINQLVEGGSNARHFLLTRVTYLLLLEAYMKDTLLRDILETDKKFLSRLQTLNKARNSNSHYNKVAVQYDGKELAKEFNYVSIQLIENYKKGMMGNE